MRLHDFEWCIRESAEQDYNFIDFSDAPERLLEQHAMLLDFQKSFKSSSVNGIA